MTPTQFAHTDGLNEVNLNTQKQIINICKSRHPETDRRYLSIKLQLGRHSSLCSWPTLTAFNTKYTLHNLYLTVISMLIYINKL